MSNPAFGWVLPLPAPPSKLAAVPDSRRHGDIPKPTSADDKYQALREYRRAQGLYIRCAAKWSRGQKCADIDMVQIQLVQELCDLFQISDHSANSQSAVSESGDLLFLHLSMAAVSGKPGPKTMCLSEEIQSIPLSILVDSGSSHTFIGLQFPDKLTGIVPLLFGFKMLTVPSSPVLTTYLLGCY